VVFSHPDGEHDYRNHADIADAERRVGVPVTHAVIGR
jgi:hypothetical protein